MGSVLSKNVCILVLTSTFLKTHKFVDTQWLKYLLFNIFFMLLIEIT